ncbi:MAG: DUF2274 domain-containing protein [Pseudomonadota bacterium]
MATQKLKIGPLPDRTPVKVTISVEPALHAELKLYAKLYYETYGQKADMSALVPSMLSVFLASDAGFKKALKVLRDAEAAQ